MDVQLNRVSSPVYLYMKEGTEDQVREYRRSQIQRRRKMNVDILGLWLLCDVMHTSPNCTGICHVAFTYSICIPHLFIDREEIDGIPYCSHNTNGCTPIDGFRAGGKLKCVRTHGELIIFSTLLWDIGMRWES